MPTCPYCGKHKNALKNHVRLSSGDGHGPYGQYPDGYLTGSTSTDPSTAGADDADDTDPGPNADGGTQDGALSHETRRAAAETDPGPQQDTSPSENPGGTATAATATLTTPDDDATADVERRTHQTTNDEPTSPPDTSPSRANVRCPTCDSMMDPAQAGELLVVRVGGWIFPKADDVMCDDTDYICRDCGVLYDPTANESWVIVEYQGH